MSSQNSTGLSEDSLSALRDCSRILIFDDGLHVLYTTFQVGTSSHPKRPTGCTCQSPLVADLCNVWMLQVQQAELEPLTKVFGEREQAIRSGMSIQGKRYEVSVLCQSQIDALQAMLHSRYRRIRTWVDKTGDAGMLNMGTSFHPCAMEGQCRSSSA